MGLLRLAVLGPPEVFHDGCRLTFALLQEQKPLQSMLVAAEVAHLYVCLGRAYTHQNAWQQAELAYEALLAGPQIHPVLQHVQSEASPVSQDQAEPSGR